jgi:hypothetical protein
MPPDTLYDTDFYAWAQEQAALLEGQQFDALDVPHLLEELDGMRRSLEREMRNRLRVLLVHLLKLQQGTRHDLVRAGPGWERTVRSQREELRQLEEDHPSLQPYRPTALARAWRLVQRDWDGAPLEPACPWTVEQVLEDTYWPHLQCDADGPRRG